MLLKVLTFLSESGGKAERVGRESPGMSPLMLPLLRLLFDEAWMGEGRLADSFPKKLWSNRVGVEVRVDDAEEEEDRFAAVTPADGDITIDALLPSPVSPDALNVFVVVVVVVDVVVGGRGA